MWLQVCIGDLEWIWHKFVVCVCVCVFVWAWLFAKVEGGSGSVSGRNQVNPCWQEGASDPSGQEKAIWSDKAPSKSIYSSFYFSSSLYIVIYPQIVRIRLCTIQRIWSLSLPFVTSGKLCTRPLFHPLLCLLSKVAGFWPKHAALCWRTLLTQGTCTRVVFYLLCDQCSYFVVLQEAGFVDWTREDCRSHNNQSPFFSGGQRKRLVFARGTVAADAFLQFYSGVLSWQ